MNRPDPSPEDAARRVAPAIVQRIDLLTERWLAGAAPTPQQLLAAADDVAALRDLIAPSPLRHDPAASGRQRTRQG